MKNTKNGALPALAVFSLLTLLLGTVSAHAQPLRYAQDKPGAPVYIDGQILVQFKAAASDAQLSDAFQRGKLKLQEHLQTPAMGMSKRRGLTLTRTDLPVDRALTLLRSNPAVEFAEPNWVYTRQEAILDDPYFIDGSLWGVSGEASFAFNGYGSHAVDAWLLGYFGNSQVCVGVIDEGIQVSHPDLQANIWNNPGEIPDDGIDNDGNGYVDDVHGWNFVDNTANVYTVGEDQHGTHVAGTIGAVGGNGEGVVGVAWGVKIISAKFLSPNGGTTFDAVKAIDYFTDLKRQGINVVALNNSWGGNGFSQAIQDAIVRAANQNILFIAAAGNGNQFGPGSNTDLTPYFPACCDTTGGAGYDSIISVTAIDKLGNKPSWANYGRETVTLGAPGDAIFSTVPDDGYGIAAGTSMATPHVTGAVALYASVNNGKSAQQIKKVLLATSVPTVSLSGKTVTGGRLNVAAMFSPLILVDPPAELLASVVSRDQIRLVWTDVFDNEEGFLIERATDNRAFQQIATVGKGATEFRDSDLNRGKNYYYRVRAYAGSFMSPYSNVANVSTRRGQKH